MSDRLARQWIAHHGGEKITYVAGQGGVQNPVGYLAAALRDDFTTEATATQPTSAPANLLARMRDLLAARTPTQRDADRRLFMSMIDSADARADFERHGWMSALNTAAIKAFWQDLQPDAFDDI